MKLKGMLGTATLVVSLLGVGQAYATDDKDEIPATSRTAPMPSANDPETERAASNWDARTRENARRHLRSLAATGEARDLIAAALLWPAFDIPTLSLSDGFANYTDTPQQVQDWLEAARRLHPRDPLVAWVDAGVCESNGTCDPGPAIASLLQAEPDNAAVQMMGALVAEQQGDATKIQQHWRAAASATRYDTHAQEVGRLLHAALRDVAWPALDETLASTLGKIMGMQGPATAQGLGYIRAATVFVAFPWPDLMAVVQQCKPESLARADPDHRAACERTLELMAANDANLITPMIGSNLLAKSFGRSPQAASRCESLRQLRWIQTNAAEEFASQTDETTMVDYQTAFLTEGELPAMRRAMARRGIPTSAPADWRPDDLLPSSCAR